MKIGNLSHSVIKVADFFYYQKIQQKINYKYHVHIEDIIYLEKKIFLDFLLYSKFKF